MNFVGQVKLAQHNAAAAKRVGFNHVRPSLKIGSMNVFDNVRPAQHQDFRAVLLAPEVIERGMPLLYLRAHGAVIDHDAFANCLKKGFHLYSVET